MIKKYDNMLSNISIILLIILMFKKKR